MNNSYKAHSMLILAALIGGFNYTISKLVMPDFVKPMSIVIARGLLSILVFHLIHLIFVRESVEKRDYLRLFAASVFGIAVNQMTFYEGLNLTTPINASLMMTATPILVLIVSSILLKEKITFIKIIGLILGTSGTVLLLLHSGRGKVEGFFWGDILILVNASSWALFLVTVRPLIQKYHPITILKWIFLLGFFMILPFGYSDFAGTKWSLLTTDAWWAFGYIILFATFFAYFLNAAVLKYVDPSIAGSYIYLQPLLASIIAIAWGKDYFSLEKFGYLCIILIGVYLISFRATQKNDL